MSTSISLSETQLFTALVAVLNAMGLASGIAGASLPIPVIQGQVNRVPEPKAQDFVVMWPTLRTRMATNIDISTDSAVIGSITNLVLTITAVINGTVAIGQYLYGAGITSGCQITRQLTGVPGGNGTYQTTPTADVASETIYCGLTAKTQYTEIGIQLDVHGPASGDNAQRIATLMRDYFAVDAFAATGFDITPLYADDPRQAPFDNAEAQWEERWIVDVRLQANIAVEVTQQFADELIVTPIPVEIIPVA